MSIFRDSTSSKLERRFTHSNGTPTTAPPIKGTADGATHLKNTDQQNPVTVRGPHLERHK